MVDSNSFSKRSRAVRRSTSLSVSTERLIGEMVATTRGLAEDIADMKHTISLVAAEQQQSSTERRNQQLVVSNRIDALERITADQHKTNTQILSEVKAELTGMRDPVSQFVSIRKRAGAIVMVIIGVGSVLWTLSQPVYNFLIGRLFGTN